MNNNENKQYNRNINKKLIRLDEGDLHEIVKESVKKILKESNITPNLEQDMERYMVKPYVVSFIIYARGFFKRFLLYFFYIHFFF